MKRERERERMNRIKDFMDEFGYMQSSAAAGAASLLVFSVRSFVRRRRTSREKKLGDTWSSAVEVMLCNTINDSKLVLVPSPERPSESGGALPEILCTHVLFCMTAFDPPGEKRTLDENAAANARMWTDIKAMEQPAPVHVWPTWGYNLAEGWREDGFCLAFSIADDDQMDAARDAVVSIAASFGQGAVFEYIKGKTEDSMLRTTVPVLTSDAIRKVTVVWHVPDSIAMDGEETDPMLTRPWAGPEEVLNVPETTETTEQPTPAAAESSKSVESIDDKEMIHEDSAKQRRWWSRQNIDVLSPIRNLFP